MLPLATFAETDGSYINGEGRCQSFSAAASLVGESRPGWKILRVIGERLGIPDCQYASSDEVLAAFNAHRTNALVGDYEGQFAAERVEAFDAAGLHVPLYQSDPVVRRATALQQTAIARQIAVGSHVQRAVNS